MKAATRFPRILIALAFLGLASCGGGGGSDDAGTTSDTTSDTASDSTDQSGDFTGATSEASIPDMDTAMDLARAVSEGTRKAIAQKKARENTPITQLGGAQATSPLDPLGRINARLIHRASRRGDHILGASQTVPGPCGGEAIIQPEDSGKGGTIDYHGFCAGNLTMDGTVRYTFEENGSVLSYRMHYSNVTLAYADGGEETLNMTMACETDTRTFQTDCSFQEDFVGLDGLTYRIENVRVTGGPGRGYQVRSRVYHPKLGYCEANTSERLRGPASCPNNQPSGGRLTFSGANGNSVAIRFNGCQTYTVTRNDSTSRLDYWDVSKDNNSGETSGDTSDNDSGGGNSVSMTFRISDGCSDGEGFRVRLFDKTDNLVWPEPGRVYVLDPGETMDFPIACRPGNKICYGAQTTTGNDHYWGIGLDGDQGCDSCCYTCQSQGLGGGNLICP